MSRHLFAIGTEVRLKSRAGLSPAAADVYLVTAILPAHDSSPQYRLRNDALGQERVAAENNLKPIAGPVDAAIHEGSNP